MNLDTAARQPAAGSGGRFYLIGYLPAYAAALFLLLLVWAGAPAWRDRPGHQIRFTTAWATASHLSPGEIVMVALAAALLAVILQPLQLALVNLAQGSWPRCLGATWARQRQKNRRDRLARAAHLPPGADLTSEAIQRAGAAGYQLRRRFPMPRPSPAAHHAGKRAGRHARHRRASLRPRRGDRLAPPLPDPGRAVPDPRR